MNGFRETAGIFGNQLDALQDRLQVLLKERESTADLLEQVISFKNQRVAQNQNDLLTRLTQSTVDDSVNVRVITVIGLVYVSSTVVAVRIFLYLYVVQHRLTHSPGHHGYTVLSRGHAWLLAGFAAILDLRGHRNTVDGNHIAVLAVGTAKTNP